MLRSPGVRRPEASVFPHDVGDTCSLLRTPQRHSFQQACYLLSSFKKDPLVPVSMTGIRGFKTQEVILRCNQCACGCPTRDPAAKQVTKSRVVPSLSIAATTTQPHTSRHVLARCVALAPSLPLHSPAGSPLAAPWQGLWLSCRCDLTQCQHSPR